MSQERLTPQQPVECLIQSRMSRSKGGTVIASDVWTLAEHRRLVCGADGGYRQWLRGCPGCGQAKLHVHDYRQRNALAAMVLVVVTVVRFICINPQCGATWQVLPAFLAKHLWWTWRTVEGETEAQALRSAPEQSPPATPADMSPSAGTAIQRVPSTRTRKRWLERLRASAAQFVQLIKSRAGKTMALVVDALQADSTVADLVERYAQVMGIESGRRCAAVAALVDNLERGIRLM